MKGTHPFSPLTHLTRLRAVVGYPGVLGKADSIVHFNLTRPAKKHGTLGAVKLGLRLAPVTFLHSSLLELAHDVQHFRVFGIGLLPRRHCLAAQTQLLLVEPVAALETDHGLAAAGEGATQGTTTEFALEHINYRLSWDGGLIG